MPLDVRIRRVQAALAGMGVGQETRLTIEAVRSAILDDRWLMTRHARERAGKRCIGDEDLVKALSEGEILEDYPDDPRGHSFLMLGYTNEGRPLHAVCALDMRGRNLLVITVYEPSPPKWIEERTRSGREGGG